MRGIHRIFVRKTNNSYLQFFRYGFVSLAALAVDFGGLILLKEVFGLHYLTAATISFSAGLVTNYLLSLLWVFGRSKYSRLTEFSIFAGIGVVGLVLNDLILWILTGNLGLYYVLSKIVATGVTFIWNFSARKYILFRQSQEEKE